MLVAVTAATLAVREGRGPLDAYEVIRSLDSASSLEGPEETAVLLLPSFDTERSLLLGQTRDQHTWTGLYPEYQRALHEILLHQAEQGTYTHVLDCEGQDVKSTHAHIRSVLEQIMHFTAEEPS
ncbi:hypothetical protein [Nocardiopsis alba]|uniref:hypothetical protein n=1 Tax=Nocardiopsis alba TaxID=53437 RepID=UPI003672882E